VSLFMMLSMDLRQTSGRGGAGNGPAPSRVQELAHGAGFYVAPLRPKVQRTAKNYGLGLEWVILILKVSDSSLRRGAADEAIQNPRRGPLDLLRRARNDGAGLCTSGSFVREPMLAADENFSRLGIAIDHVHLRAPLPGDAPFHFTRRRMGRH
jgi:hypothetical protein